MRTICEDFIHSRTPGKVYRTAVVLTRHNELKRVCSCPARVECWHIRAARVLRSRTTRTDVIHWPRYESLVFGEQWQVLSKEVYGDATFGLPNY